jgi:branched-subunit amino acid aminotransferase/4-amino-4-deoxychorismate lyase
MSYGHFTAMQVRGGATRGLALHLARLDAANRELFDAPLDGDLVRARIREALGDTSDASVRVIVEDGSGRAEKSAEKNAEKRAGTSADKNAEQRADQGGVRVTVRPPAPDPPSPQRLQSVPYLRPVAHLKHTDGFAQEYYWRRADRAGFDEILLTDLGGEIAEAGIANVCFVRGDALIWPTAPHLAGITMQLLLAAPEMPSRREPVRRSDLPAFDGGFLTNSHGIAVIGGVDELALPVADPIYKILVDVYAAAPWDRI